MEKDGVMGRGQRGKIATKLHGVISTRTPHVGLPLITHAVV